MHHHKRKKHPLPVHPAGMQVSQARRDEPQNAPDPRWLVQRVKEFRPLPRVTRWKLIYLPCETAGVFGIKVVTGLRSSLRNSFTGVTSTPGSKPNIVT